MTIEPLTSALISAADLAAILHQPRVRIVDATYGQPPSHMGIDGAVHFDIDQIADPHGPLPHTVPSAADFADAVGRLGIGNDDRVIVYDQEGVSFAAARVWWMFRLFGHDNVQVLDGGLPAWVRAGNTLAPKNAAPQPVFFTANYRPQLLKNIKDIEGNIKKKSFTLIDARDPRRFAGSVPEPRPNMQAGHVPGSSNVFFSTLIDPSTGLMNPRTALEGIFSNSHADLGKPVACTCGSGVTACVVALALYEIGIQDAAIYDGSWTEWATTPNMPVEKGAA